MECLESKILKTEMFEVQCVTTENWNLYVKCLKSKMLRTKMSKLGMCKYLKLTIESWNLKSLCETFGTWKLKCLNLNMGILKVENWKLKSLKRI